MVAICMLVLLMVIAVGSVIYFNWEDRKKKKKFLKKQS